MAAIICPHCESLSAFGLRHSWDDSTADGTRTQWGVWVCSNTSCQRPIVGRRFNSEPASEYWPKSPVRLPSFGEVPPSIKSDAVEAHVCLQAGANRAAAVMARRAIQGSCFDKGAPDKRPLEQIDYLKDNQLITPQMAEIAHHIRSLGGSGAHPGKDGLEDVTSDEAGEALEFLRQFMEYVYTIPASLERLRPASQDQEAPTA